MNSPRLPLLNQPAETVYFGDFDAFKCELRVRPIEGGRFRGHLYLTYPGDGFSMPHEAETPDSYATPQEAIDAAKASLEAVAGQWDMDPPDDD